MAQPSEELADLSVHASKAAAVLLREEPDEEPDEEEDGEEHDGDGEDDDGDEGYTE